MNKRIGFWVASGWLFLGVSLGALVGAWLNVYVWQHFDPKFADARILPFVFDFMFLELLLATTLELLLLVSWWFARPYLENLQPWQFAAAGLVCCLLTTVFLTFVLL